MIKAGFKAPEQELKSNEEKQNGAGKNMIMIAGVGALAVLVVVGIVVYFVAFSKPEKSVAPPPVYLEKSSSGFASVLTRDPVRAMQIAFTKHTVPAVAVLVTLLLVITAIVVAVVLLKAPKPLPPPKKDLEWNELMLEDPAAFFKKPKYAGLGVLAIVVVLGGLIATGFGIKRCVSGPNEPPLSQAVQARTTELLTLYNNMYNSPDYAAYPDQASLDDFYGASTDPGAQLNFEGTPLGPYRPNWNPVNIFKHCLKKAKFAGTPFKRFLVMKPGAEIKIVSMEKNDVEKQLRELATEQAQLDLLTSLIATVRFYSGLDSESTMT